MFKRFWVRAYAKTNWFCVWDSSTNCLQLTEGGAVCWEDKAEAQEFADRLNGENPEDPVKRFLENGRSEWFRSRPVLNGFRALVIEEVRKVGERKRKKGHSFAVEESAIHGFRLVKV